MCNSAKLINIFFNSIFFSWFHLSKSDLIFSFAISNLSRASCENKQINRECIFVKQLTYFDLEKFICILRLVVDIAVLFDLIFPIFHFSFRSMILPTILICYDRWLPLPILPFPIFSFANCPIDKDNLFLYCLYCPRLLLLHRYIINILW